MPSKIGNRRRRAAAPLDKLRAPCGIDIESCNRKTSVEQTMRERLTQQSDADQPDRASINHWSNPRRATPAGFGAAA